MSEFHSSHPKSNVSEHLLKTVLHSGFTPPIIISAYTFLYSMTDALPFYRTKGMKNSRYNIYPARKINMRQHQFNTNKTSVAAPDIKNM